MGSPDRPSVMMQKEDVMNTKSFWQRRRKSMFVVAPANGSTWAVAFSRRLIPGALFASKTAAVRYAYLLAGMAGLGGDDIRVLGEA
jgi:hypothetical protein